ncbi:hypothetical protein [Hydrocarboniphaga effusa]|uniref:hypothetical protein n=1 Tax=Hydrocarboniphaga effusa TaxID=243629 RepID=UPI003BAC93FA
MKSNLLRDGLEPSPDNLQAAVDAKRRKDSARARLKTGAVVAALIGVVVVGFKAAPVIADAATSLFASDAKTNSGYHMSKVVVGCQSRSVYSRMVELVSQGDSTAAQLLVMSAGDDCMIFLPGDQVLIDERAGLSEARVHKVGDPTSYWVNRELVVRN